MAEEKKTTKRTATRKTRNAKKVQAEEKTVSETMTETRVNNKETFSKEKRIFENTDLISCTCVYPGSVGMLGKRTGNKYLWEGMGVVEYIEYQDLRSEILNKRSVYIYEPLIIINNEDFLNQNPDLKKLYEDFYTPDEIIKNIKELELDKLIKFINSLPSGIKNNVKSIAATMIANGSLDSVKKIKALDGLFSTNLAMYSYDI